MKLIAVLFLCVAVANALLSDEEEWQKFKSLHHKNYLSESEEGYRFKVFKENLNEIRKHNEKYVKGESTFEMGVNQFTDMTHEEFKEIYGKGILPPKNEENKLGNA